MRFTFRLSLVLVGAMVFGQAARAAERFRLLGEFVAFQTNGMVVRYEFGLNNEFTWTVEQPGKAPETHEGVFQTEGQNPFTIDFHFSSRKLRGITFQGIAEVLSTSELRIDGMPSNKGPRPTTFGTNTLLFAAKKSALNSVIPTVRIDGTTYSNVVIDAVSGKTVTFSHSRGVASFNPAKITAEERAVLGVPEPQAPPEPKPEPKRIGLSSLPLKGRTIFKLLIYGIFALVAPPLIWIAAKVVRVEEVSAGRCFNAGIGGSVAFVVGLVAGLYSHSLLVSIGVTAAIWIIVILIALKTSMIKAFAVWLMAHGTIAVALTVLSQFVDVRGELTQIAAKSRNDASTNE